MFHLPETKGLVLERGKGGSNTRIHACSLCHICAVDRCSRATFHLESSVVFFRLKRRVLPTFGLHSTSEAPSQVYLHSPAGSRTKRRCSRASSIFLGDLICETCL